MLEDKVVKEQTLIEVWVNDPNKTGTSMERVLQITPCMARAYDPPMPRRSTFSRGRLATGRIMNWVPFNHQPTKNYSRAKLVYKEARKTVKLNIRKAEEINLKSTAQKWT